MARDKGVNEELSSRIRKAAPKAGGVVKGEVSCVYCGMYLSYERVGVKGDTEVADQRRDGGVVQFADNRANFVECRFCPNVN